MAFWKMKITGRIGRREKVLLNLLEAQFINPKMRSLLCVLVSVGNTW